MSAGGLAIAPLAIPVIVAAGAVIVVGGAAVLLVRAAGTATEAAAAGVVHLADAMEQASNAQLDEQRTARLWEIAASEVVGLNTSIRVLGGAARRGGALIDLPEPLDPVCLNLAQIRDWCVATRSALLVARTQLDLASEARERTRFTQTASTSAAEVLARHQETLRQRHERHELDRTPMPVPTAADRATIDTQVAHSLKTLDKDVRPDERFFVLEAATNVSRHEDRGTADTYLTELRERVKTVNRKAAQRRLAATWLTALERDIVAAEPNPPYPHLVGQLRQVVDGDAELTAELRNAGQVALRRAEAVAERELVQDTVRECLTNLGYSVDRAFDVTHANGLRVTRSDWGTQHFAELWFDPRTVDTHVIRQHGTNGAEAAALDAERCDDFNDDIEKVREVLRQRGIGANAKVQRGRTVQRASSTAQTDIQSTRDSVRRKDRP